MAKIKVVKKEKSIEDNMSDDYKQLLKDTGAFIYRKPNANTANYSILSTYSVKPKRERGPKKKKRKK